MDSLKATAMNPAMAAQAIAFSGWPYPGEEELQWVPEHRVLAQQILIVALHQLEDKYREVLIGRYGPEAMTLEEYGEKRLNGVSRERVRQVEAKAFRELRHILINRLQYSLTDLHAALRIVPVPDGPRDPAWISTTEASRLTALSMGHIRHLAREGTIRSRPHPTKGMRVQIHRQALKGYVQGYAGKGRGRKGIWNEEDSDG